MHTSSSSCDHDFTLKYVLLCRRTLIYWTFEIRLHYLQMINKGGIKQNISKIPSIRVELSRIYIISLWILKPVFHLPHLVQSYANNVHTRLHILDISPEKASCWMSQLHTRSTRGNFLFSICRRGSALTSLSSQWTTKGRKRCVIGLLIIFHGVHQAIQASNLRDISIAALSKTTVWVSFGKCLTLEQPGYTFCPFRLILEHGHGQGYLFFPPESRCKRTLLLFSLGSRCMFTQTRHLRFEGKLRLAFWNRSSIFTILSGTGVAKLSL